MARLNFRDDADLQRFWEVDKPRLPIVPRPAAQRWWDALPDIVKVPWLLPIAGATIYALLRIGYSRFYWRLGLQPEDVGLGYAETLEQSLVDLLLIILVCVAIFAVLVFFPTRVFRYLVSSTTRAVVIRHRYPGRVQLDNTSPRGPDMEPLTRGAAHYRPVRRLHAPLFRNVYSSLQRLQIAAKQSWVPNPNDCLRIPRKRCRSAALDSGGAHRSTGYNRRGHSER